MHCEPLFGRFLSSCVFSTLVVSATQQQLPNLSRRSGGVNDDELFLQQLDSEDLVSFDSGFQLQLQLQLQDDNLNNPDNKNLFSSESASDDLSLLDSPLSAFDNNHFFDDGEQNDDPSLLAMDCLSLDLLPPTLDKFKSRPRPRSRRDQHPICPTPPSGSGNPDNNLQGDDDSSFPTLPAGLGTQDFLEQGLTSKNHKKSSNCLVTSAGILPYGVCSSKNPADRTPLMMIQPLPMTWGVVKVWDLHGCFLSPTTVLCPNRYQDFFCCLNIEESPTGDTEGRICILYDDLFSANPRRFGS